MAGSSTEEALLARAWQAMVVELDRKYPLVSRDKRNARWQDIRSVVWEALCCATSDQLRSVVDSYEWRLTIAGLADGWARDPASLMTTVEAVTA